MKTYFLGDDDHRSIQESQLETLQQRGLDLGFSYWDGNPEQAFKNLEEFAPQEPILLIASRLGALPAIHWTAENPSRIRRLILLQPALHLNLAGLNMPKPHFVPTLIVCHSRESNPNPAHMMTLAGKMFLSYSAEYTPEPPTLESTLSLLAL